MKAFILLSMLFLHIFDDFFIQSCGFLVNCKQRDWWKKNAPEPMYEHDYIIGLLWHAFSWTFMIMLPIAWLLDFELTNRFLICFGLNWYIHMIVDHFKANVKKINLVVDQLIHVIQILLTYAFVAIAGGLL